MNDWKEFFKGKKVTQMGLGLLGRGIGDADFLAEHCAEVIVTDLKKRADLEDSLKKLAHRKNITFVLGGHRMEDFKNRDFILKSAGVPIDSPFIAEAQKNNIPIEMDASLFVKLAPKGVKIVGVTGTRGKSTTTALIYDVLKKSGRRIFLGGNIVPSATLPFLEKIYDTDVVVLELDSWQLQGFGDSKISPQIAVFTTFLKDHMGYYNNDMEVYFNDKANIFKYQKDGDYLVVGEDIADEFNFAGSGEIEIACRSDVPDSWRRVIEGEHNRLNIACALKVAEIFGVRQTDFQDVLKHFMGLPGRLELVKIVNGIRIYNDTNSTTPDATIAALRALGREEKKNIILIMGGDDKKLDMSELVAEIPKWCSKVVLFKERGTDTVRDAIFKLANTELEVFEEDGLEATVKRAFSLAKEGDIILYSPAFSSFGKWFKNEYDRGDRFMEIVRKLE